MNIGDVVAVGHRDCEINIDRVADCKTIQPHNEISPSVSPKYLQEQLGLKSASVTAVLDRLEKAGHITRTISAHDRHSWDISLTKVSHQAADDLYEVLGPTIAPKFAQRGEQEMAVAIRAIDDLIKSLDLAADKIS